MKWKTTDKKEIIIMVFVFGSNLSGIHGAGAAKYAHKKLGAVWGIGEGYTEGCYALPTKGYHITDMSVTRIGISIQRFLKFAKANPSMEFKVTQVGCGLGGHKASDIAPMFYKHTNNVYFDEAWKYYLPPDTKFWGTF